MKDRKDNTNKGDIASIMFDLECYKRKIHSFRCLSDGCSVDRIVLNKKGTKISVQIKSSTTMHTSDIVHVNVKKNAEKKHTPYSEKDGIDIFACYLFTTNSWYLIPSNLVYGIGTINLNTKKGRFEIYKERWDLLEC